jgi:hypothetical protein
VIIVVMLVFPEMDDSFYDITTVESHRSGTCGFLNLNDRHFVIANNTQLLCAFQKENLRRLKSYPLKCADRLNSSVSGRTERIWTTDSPTCETYAASRDNVDDQLPVTSILITDWRWPSMCRAG